MNRQNSPIAVDLDAWPPLPYAAWKETCETLQLWTQIVGKVQLALTPFLNEWWNIAFHLTARGLTTGLIPYRDRAFEVRFDFVDHNLVIETDEGATRALSLQPRAVAAFYGEVMGMLEALDIAVTINPVPCEIPNPIPCDVNEAHASYDAEYAARWWRIQLQIAKVLQVYRSAFVGKSSPIQFFWGSFDLSHTRFSGRPAPLPQGVPHFFQLAEDQENVACGFWPGNPNASGVELGEPAFYAYIYPEPDGFKEAAVRPDAAYYDPKLGEFILPYEAVRRAAEPEQALLEFFQSTYAAAADLAKWDRAVLERLPG
ncbi:MAG: hypothetical protein JO122_02595 [Acetobacteraceae bacterium]|nr:hypothetical protein [Acetobacteraceae bacterium]